MAQRPISNASEHVVRASVSFPHDDYAMLEKMASKKRVSVAWVVREAVSSYLAVAEEKMPGGKK